MEKPANGRRLHDAISVELNAVYAAGRAAKPAARLFTDFLIEALKSD